MRHDHLEPPSSPFVNIQIDFVHMPSGQGYKYLLVITEQTQNYLAVDG